MDYGNILLTILDNFAKVLPVRIVYDTQQGVRWTFGRSKGSLNPGLHFFIPFIQTIHPYDITEGPLDLGEQTLTLQENEPYTFQGELTYRIREAQLCATRLGDDAPKILRTRGRLALARHVFGLPKGKDVIEKRENLEEKIKNALGHYFEPRGIEILEFGFSKMMKLDGNYGLVGINNYDPNKQDVS